MFDFRIIKCADGTEIVEPNIKTPFAMLTPLQMAEYSMRIIWKYQ